MVIVYYLEQILVVSDTSNPYAYTLLNDAFVIEEDGIFLSQNMLSYQENLVLEFLKINLL